MWPSLLLLGGLAHAADRDVDSLRQVEDRAATLASAMEDLRRNFSARRGLIGATEARQRYEDALYLYLMESYEDAATEFYILSQSRALSSADLTRDSEWYLAECLFEMGDLHTATEAYEAILAQGSSHPYHDDAVRRLLEVSSILRHDAEFDQLYAEWITTGRVRTTDLVTYALGRAFARRGQLDRAQTHLASLAPTSPYYARAQYVLGSVAIQQGNLPAALAALEASANVTPGDDAGRRVQELAALGEARVATEMGDYARASTWYAKVGESSPDYADALYESAWAFILQERWAEAKEQCDRFLKAFPSHRYTASMTILRGHLDMKTASYADAEIRYGSVGRDYTPVIGTLDGAAQDPAALRRLLDEMAGFVPVGGVSSNVPGYARELLRADPDVGRAASVWRDLGKEKAELAEVEDLARVLEKAAQGDKDLLSTYVAARQEVAGLEGQSLALRAQVLDAEIATLRARLPSSARPTLSGLAKERLSVYGSGGDADAATVRARLAEVRTRLVALRAQAPGGEAAYTRLDRTWASLDALDTSSRATRELIDGSEATETAAVKQRLAETLTAVRELRTDLDTTAVTSEQLAVKVVSAGVGGVADQLRLDVLTADKGVVDSWWLRKTDTTDGMATLSETQQDVLKELDAKFGVLRENLQP